ncbi:MAG: fibronectin type III domain-containing protein [Pseudomonadota bacterium]
MRTTVWHLGFISVLLGAAPFVHPHDTEAAEDWQPTEYAPAMAYAPTPLPDRVVLTWSDDPATTQSVTWRTDTTVQRGVAELALAGPNGRAMKTEPFVAETQSFESDHNTAHYHTLTFRDLEPDTLYAYRVGDGVNWTEFFHFRTASADPAPFRFVYFGDAQNDVKTHWSRVFREAFRDAPRAAFMLHAGDLIDVHSADVEWGEWHGGPGWVNGTIPVLATPGNHEYHRVNGGPPYERIWSTKDGRRIPIVVQFEPRKDANGVASYLVKATFPEGETGQLELDQGGTIATVDAVIEGQTGFAAEEIIGTGFQSKPLQDQQRDPGDPAVSRHWRPQFEFPVQNPPEGLEETVYYVDYQDVRIISLDSNRDREAQVPWLRAALENNPNRWTILTFHHPMFSPAYDRDDPELRSLWKPLLDEYRVDLVLNGHDHSYLRTGIPAEPVDASNVPSGYQQAYDPKIGTVYVVSVSGPKMYPNTKGNFAARVAEDTQLYQVIDVSDRKLDYRAYTATGDLYDAFTLEKRNRRPNRLREFSPLPPERRRTASQ